MKLEARCPDCNTQLLEVVALPKGYDGRPTMTQITLGQLISLKGEDQVGYCTNCQRLWEAKTRYDEVFAGKHQGDPK